MSARHPPGAEAVREGFALLRLGRLAEAEGCFRDAVRQLPDAPSAQRALGTVLGALGRPGEAEPCFRAALRLDPGSADAHGNLGNVLRELGRLAEAEGSLRAALALRPDYPEAHNNLGALMRDSGRAGAAEEHLRAALRLRPGFPEASANLGRLLRDGGRPAEAAECFGAAARSRPDDVGARLELAAALRALHRPAEAAEHLRAALRSRPDDVAARVELGGALHDMGHFAEAADSFRAALRSQPDLPDAQLGLGTVLGVLGQFDEAEASLRDALRLRPGLAEAHNALGDVHRSLGRPEAAEASLREALRLRSDFPEARTNLAFALLQAGRFAEGWAEHEQRGRARPWVARTRHFAQPRWRGELLAGRALLLHAEQGMGDTIQFCRYAALIEGGEVVLEVQPPLVRLLSGLPGAARVVTRGETLPPFDVHCPLMSLPHVFGTTPDTVPAAIPYLGAAPAAVAAWRERLAGLPPGLRVGLCWAGDPAMSADGRRSVPPDALAPLAGIAGVRFVSLQKGAAARRPPPGLRMLDDAPALRDFADTAALVSALDLVVSADTAVLHLAGALGRPVWLLDRFDSCWRWLSGRRDSPWYPTLRRFPQPAPGDWAGAIGPLRDALAALAAGPPGR